MSSLSLYQNMQEHGTITEDSKEIPDPKFALPSTINWMRALSIIVTESRITFDSSRKHFDGKVQKRALNEKEYNSLCEQMLFSLNQIANLRALQTVENEADTARMAIVSWYYGIYTAASAMIVAADGSFPDTHTSTAKQWAQHFPSKGLTVGPFADHLHSLVSKKVELQINELRKRGKHPLTRKPSTLEEAWGCHNEYLSGTAKWEKWKVEERLRGERNFKELGVDNFRGLAAKTLRDEALNKKSVSFIHLASRYRGKANYRDAVYLSYGKSVPTLLKGYTADLAQVLTSFTSMAAAYASLRVGKERWNEFLDDLEEKRAISLSPKSEWG